MNKSRNFILVDEQPLFSRLSYVNPERCKKCGGQCCKESGCAFSPDDFPALSILNREDAKHYLRFRLNQGQISIALHIKEEFEYLCVRDVPFVNFTKERSQQGLLTFYLRMRNKGRPIVDIFGLDPNKRYPCAALTPTGCPLPFKRRPKEGRLLIPGEFDCYSMYPLEKAYKDWTPYQDIMYDLAKEYVTDVPYPFRFR